MSFPLTTDPQHDYPHIPLPKSSFLRRIWSPEPVSRLPLFIDKIPFYRDPVELAHCLQSSLTNGLTEPEAQTRLKVYGENVLKGKGKPTIWLVLWRQVWNAMTLILVAALIIAVIIDDYSEGGFIAAIVVTNVAIGFFQEYRAECAMESLQKLCSPIAKVIRQQRNGVQTVSIPTSSVTVGDIVELRTGQVVPADIRLFSTLNLQIDESLLTGESLTALKGTEMLSRYENDDTPIGDCFNIAYSGTIVMKGEGRGIVYATGMETEIGKIGRTLQKNQAKIPPTQRPTFRERFQVVAQKILGLYNTSPLQKKLTKLAHYLFITAVILVIILFAISRFKMSTTVALYAISLALAIIPESLIAVVTATLAKGVTEMARRNAIVRRLDALEALGGISDICLDKTGTITMGKMVVRTVWNGKGVWECKSSDLSLDELSMKLVEGEETEVGELLRCVSLCNDAVVVRKADVWSAYGEATEVALQIFAAKSDFLKSGLVASAQDLQSLKAGVRYIHVREHHFDWDSKRMSVVYHDLQTQNNVMFMKGAPECVLEACSYDVNGELLTEERKAETLRVMETLAGEGLRVLAFASMLMKTESSEFSCEPKELTLLGLVAIYDPPRPEAPQVVQACHRAGIVVHMLTGDHITTARAIATEVGIVTAETQDTSVMTAQHFDRLNDAEVDALPSLPLVIARCSPHTKVKMIKAIHRRGRLAAMTGDGVNDSLSLKAADVGIAMGLAPSDVAKQAAEIVLADDKLTAIVGAVADGRRIFDNLIKFMLHLLSSNVAEAVVLVVGLAFLDASRTSVYPLSAVQILWENLVTSIFPAFALGLEPASPNIMNRPPRNLISGVFNKEFAVDTAVYGLIMGIPPLLSFVAVVYGAGGGNLGIDCNDHMNASCNVVYRARAAVFASITIIILLHGFQMKDTRKSMFRMDLLENRTLFISVMGGCIALLPTIYIDHVNESVFKMTDISWEWGLCAASVAFYIAGVEVYKALKRRFWKCDLVG